MLHLADVLWQGIDWSPNLSGNGNAILSIGQAVLKTVKVKASKSVSTSYQVADSVPLFNNTEVNHARLDDIYQVDDWEGSLVFLEILIDCCYWHLMSLPCLENS